MNILVTGGAGFIWLQKLTNERIYDDEKIDVSKWLTKRPAVSYILYLPNTTLFAN